MASNLPLTEAVEAEQAQTAGRKEKPSYPSGFEPGVKFNGYEGQLTTEPLEAPPEDWDEVLSVWGLDPDKFEVIPPVSFSAWDSARGGEPVRLFSYKANVKLRSKFSAGYDYDDLVQEIKKYKAPKKKAPSGDSSFVVCLADWQLGKALADDTPIYTTEGWKKHGELVPGDHVFGPDGLPKLVTHVTGSSLMECSEVRFDGDVTIVASNDHEWEGYRPYRRKVDGIEKLRDVPLRLTTSEIAAIKTRPSRAGNTIQDRAFRVRLPAALEFAHNDDLLIDPYLFGYWLGDGNRRAGIIAVGTEDVESFLSEVPEGKIQKCSRDDRKSVSVYGLKALLRDEGALYTKSVPEKYLYGSINQRLALLQGLLDSDGSISAEGIIDFGSVDPQISEAVAFLLESLGHKVWLSEKMGTLNGVEKKRVYRVGCSASAGFKYFRLQRKQDRVPVRKPVEHISRVRTIREVVSVGQQSAQCITVDGGLYLAGPHFVPTHNCDFGGTAEIIQAIQDRIEWVKQRILELRKIGRPLGTLYVVGLGDLVEMCNNNYAQQLFTVELNIRDQLKVARRLIRDCLVAWAPLFEKVVVSAVGGNHGQAGRQDGKNVTDDADNHDVAVFEMVAEILAQNSAFDHVSFYLPSDDLHVVLDISGTLVAFTHGHTAGSGSTPQKKLSDWWAKMAFTDKPVGDASILVSGHYHHLSLIDHGPRLHVQAPAMDCGSKWWEDRGGGTSKRGTLTFVIDANGLRDLEVI